MTTRTGSTRRRASTFGSVRKLPSARFQASYWHEGNRHIAPHTFPTKADADAWLAQVRTAIGMGAWIDPEAGTIEFRAYSTKWLDQRHDLAQSTRELYAYLLELHVLPVFGPAPLAKITTGSVRSWNALLAAEHPTTAAKAYRLMAAIFKTAVDDHHVVVSPVRVKGAAAEKAAERPMATVAEVQSLADAMPKDLRMVVLLAAWCQLRRGELLGLRRRDIDLLRGTLTVAMTKVKTMGGTMIDKAPKTDAGRRAVAIPPNVQMELAKHLNEYVGREPDSLLFSQG